MKGTIEYVGMVRGLSDPVFQRLLKQLRTNAPDLVSEVRLIKQKTSVLVMTEGQTDPKHLEASLAYLNRKGLFHHLDIEFQDFPKGAVLVAVT